jgi:ribosomal protein L30/L7E
MLKREIMKIKNDILLILAYLGVTKFNDTVIFKETNTVLSLDSLVTEEQVKFKELLVGFGKETALSEYQHLLNDYKEHTEFITVQDVLDGKLLWEKTEKLIHVPVYQFIFSRLYKERTTIAKELFKRATTKISDGKNNNEV